VQRVAQTCTARLSGPAPLGFSPASTPVSASSNGGGFANAVPAQQQAAAVPLEADGRQRTVVKNTFIEIEEPDGSPVAPVAQSCTARLVGQASSGYETPGGIHGPPPAHAPPSAPPPPAPPTSSQPVRQTVKNTFLEFSDSDNSTRHDRVGSQSCTARLSDASPSFMISTVAQDPMCVPLANNSPGGGPAMPPPLYEAPVGLDAKTTPSPPAGPPKHLAKAPSGAQAGETGLVSAGSALHGTLAADGQPACKPCAWFYKEGSCLNAEECGYCHLCPQGELKNRKKTKVTALRKAELEVGGSSPMASNSGVSPKAAAAKKVVCLSSLI